MGEGAGIVTAMVHTGLILGPGIYACHGVWPKYKQTKDNVVLA